MKWLANAIGTNNVRRNSTFCLGWPWNWFWILERLPYLHSVSFQGLEQVLFILLPRANWRSQTSLYLVVMTGTKWQRKECTYVYMHTYLYNTHLLEMSYLNFIHCFIKGILPAFLPTGLFWLDPKGLFLPPKRESGLYSQKMLGNWYHDRGGRCRQHFGGRKIQNSPFFPHWARFCKFLTSTSFLQEFTNLQKKNTVCFQK